MGDTVALCTEGCSHESCTEPGYPANISKITDCLTLNWVKHVSVKIILYVAQAFDRPHGCHQHNILEEGRSSKLQETTQDLSKVFYLGKRDEASVQSEDLLHDSVEDIADGGPGVVKSPGYDAI